MFLKNAWYVAAESEELGREIIARTLLNEPVAMYRTESGKPVILYDRCVHRQAPLSLGEVEGDEIRCLYHGLTYDRTGQCTHVPGQSSVPPGAKVRSYPTVEKYKWIWVWMGDEEKADESLIPDFRWNDMDGWTTTGERMVMKGSYQLLVDNLLDLSHLGYLHQRTIGNTPVAELAGAQVERTEKGVRVSRLTPDSPPPPLWRTSRGFEENIDRWQIIDYTPPAAVIIESSGAPAGECKTDEERHKYPLQYILNFITPETDTSLHYFWKNARDYKQEDKDLTQMMFDQVHATFLEDTEMVEGQQDNYNLEGAIPKIDINADAGSIEARRVLDALISSEQPGA